MAAVRLAWERVERIVHSVVPLPANADDQQVVASDNPSQKPSYDNSAASSCSFSAIGDFVYPDGGIALNRNGVIEELYDTILLSQEIVPEDISGYPSDRVTVAPLGFGIPEQRDHETQFAEDDLSTYLM